MRYLSLFVYCLILCSCQPSSKLNPDFRMVLYYLDNRAPVDSLYPYLDGKDYHLEIRTIQAFGQLQDTVAIDSLLARLNHPFHDLREATILSLGQIGYGTTSRRIHLRIQDALVKQYVAERSWKHKSAVLEGLSKCGDSTGLAVVSQALQDTLGPVVEAACLASARLAIRGFTAEHQTAQLADLTVHASADVRWKSVYALMRIRDKKFAPRLVPRLKDDDYRVRMDAARGLGAMRFNDGDTTVPAYQNALIETATSDPDWRVRVNAVNALGNFRFKLDNLTKIYFLVAFEGIKDKSEHVRISAIRSMARSYDQDIRSTAEFIRPFTDRFLPASTVRERGEILLALSQMVRGDVFLDRRLMAQMDSALVHEDRYLRAQATVALGETKSEKAIPYLEKALEDTFALVMNNAAEALGKIGGKAANRILIKSLRTSNPWRLLICAGVLAADSTVMSGDDLRNTLTQSILQSYAEIRGAVDRDVKTGLIDVLGELRSAKAVTFLESFLSDSLAKVAQSAADNLKKITGRDYSRRVLVSPIFHAIDFEYFVRVKEHQPSATIETDRGDIEIDLFVDEAPFSVVNFLKLAERGYYDGSTFHRVVPNFVVQDGDPTGTGWGGPAYSIRSEFSSRTYERGTVGMASSGKDTEGSQWFITHTPQPHLDGRYTIFARVTKGMDVADGMQVGDRIRAVRVKWY